MVKQVFRLIYIATGLLTVGCTPELDEVGTMTDSQDSIFTYTMYFDSPRPSYDGTTRINNAGEWENGDMVFLYLLGPNEAYAQAVYNSSSKNWTVISSVSLVSAQGADCHIWCAEGKNPVQSSADGSKYYQYEYMTAAFSTTYLEGIYTCSNNRDIFVNATLRPRCWRIRFTGNPGATVRIEESNEFYHNSRVYYDGKYDYLSASDNFELTVGNDGYTDYFVGYASQNCSQIRVTNVAEGITYNRHFDTETLSSSGGSGCYTIPTASSLHGWTREHEYVDLGLPSGTMWAICNIGANSPEEPGEKYALGEVETKSEYIENNYHYSFQDIFERNSRFDTSRAALYSLKEENDVAVKKWGKEWSMPSLFEVAELQKYCTQEEVKIGDKKLIKHTSIINGNSIYLLKDGLCWMKSAIADVSENFDDVVNATVFAMSAPGLYSNFNFSSAFAGANIRPNYHSLPIVYPCSAEMEDHTLSMTIGERQVLNVSVLPENASFTFGKWRSRDTTIVAVNEYGEVTAVGNGKTIVTFSDPFRLFYEASCSIEVSESHDFVDLGLPSGIKWATCNVGANSPEEYGDYFAWGETEPKEYYSWSTYKWCQGSHDTMTKYCTQSSYGTVDNKATLDPEDDAAHVNWGGAWRMPTQAELDELYNKCTLTWSEQNGISGYKVKGPNGNFIFLPAAGDRYNGNLYSAGSSGYYWSSSLHSSSSNSAYCLFFNSSNYDWWYGYDRFIGHSVRPVCQ